MAEVVLSPQAYCKIVLHAAKYPHCSVNGLLLAEKPKNKDIKGLKIIDAVPLFHLTLTLTPMLEVALTQVDTYCRAHGLMIGGYYHANEHYEDNKPNLVATRLADKVHDHCNEACLLMVDNQRLTFDCERELYTLYTSHDGKWKLSEHKGDTVDRSSLAMASSLLHSSTYRDIIDFDNHLDDISQDWRNLEINEILKHAT